MTATEKTATEKTATEKTSVKKFSGLTIALIILCVVFIVATIGVIAYYVPLINSKNSKISSLQNQLSSANSTTSSLNSQISNLTSIINLQQNTVVANDKTVSEGNSEYYNFTLSANYAGYVVVTVQSSTVAGTWVEAIYSSHGLNYNQAYTGSHAINVGNSAVFPILPSSSITIGVGNGLSFLSSGATETVTITYYY
jgi:cell division protein FtsL